MEKSGWLVVNIPCRGHGTGYSCGGSFLRPLKWWDAPNGASLEAQLNSADESLLRYEALIAAEWIKGQKT